MRPPDLTIGPRNNPYMLRWRIFQWRGWMLALHKICRSDDDRALHDHSAPNISLILRGCYIEIRNHEGAPINWRVCPALSIVRRKAAMPHRIIIPEDGPPVWSLWLRAPASREWGFYCKNGWRHWKEYCASPDYSKPGDTSEVGRGCD